MISFGPAPTSGSRTTTGRPGPQTARKLYLREGGRLAFEPRPPTEAGPSFDEYISDPARPVPYYPRPISAALPQFTVAGVAGPGSAVRPSPPGRAQLRNRAADARRRRDRPGRWRGLFASTSGTDSDWIVKLIDVYPEDEPQPLAGYQLMIANDVFRGRFRKSFEHPEPMIAGQVEEYTVDLHWNDHRFTKGHKIMVQIQSTWFPLIDRNPQKFVPNIFEAKASDYQIASQRVYRTAATPTHLELSVMPATIRKATH